MNELEEYWKKAIENIIEKTGMWPDYVIHRNYERNSIVISFAPIEISWYLFNKELKKIVPKPHALEEMENEITLLLATKRNEDE